MPSNEIKDVQAAALLQGLASWKGLAEVEQTPKFCVDCKHHSFDTGSHVCLRVRDLVTGTNTGTVLCGLLRSGNPANHYHAVEVCGPDALLFEPKEDSDDER